MSDLQDSQGKITDYLLQFLDPERPVAVLLSGGVDSSVALASLQHYGCRRITAYYLKIWFQEDAQFLGDCPWEEDLEYAGAVCEQLDIPLRVVPMQQQYYDYVVDYTLRELRSGRTPSPDVLCNQYIKFGTFMRYLEGLEGLESLESKAEQAKKSAVPAEKQKNVTKKAPKETTLIATGHYALLEAFGTGKTLMRQAPDAIKDQSYFLAQLSPEQLQKLVFPLGCLQKYEVRRLAEYWGLATAKRKDSQGICFLGKVKFRDFAQHYLGENLGPIVDSTAMKHSTENETEHATQNEIEQKILGQHRGLWFHTIGQRQGLGLGGGPWYVSGKDMEKNILYVRHAQSYEQAQQAQKQDPQEELRQSFSVGQGSWLLEKPPFEKVQAEFPDGHLCLKLRHGPAKFACDIVPKKSKHGESRANENTESSQAEAWHVRIEKGDRGIAPGQFAVFYWGNICLGSANIQSI